MNRMYLLSGMAAGLILGLGGRVSADPFEDVVDTWTVPIVGEVGSVPLIEGLDGVTYTHDLNQEIDLAAGNQVIEAWLELTFTNDFFDEKDITFFGTTTTRKYREFVKYRLDGGDWVNLNEVDNGPYSNPVDVDLLNDDGLLRVTVRCYAGENWPSGTGEAWLTSSRVYGNAVVPLPGAVLLGVLGVSAAGFGLRKRW